MGAGAKTRLESRIKKFTPHCIYRYLPFGTVHRAMPDPDMASIHAAVELRSQGFTWSDLVLAAAGVKEGHDLSVKNADPAKANELVDGTPRGDLKLLANALQFNPGYQTRPAEYHMPYPGSPGGVLLSEPLPLWERHALGRGETLAERFYERYQTLLRGAVVDQMKASKTQLITPLPVVKMAKIWIRDVFCSQHQYWCWVQVLGAGAGCKTRVESRITMGTPRFIYDWVLRPSRVLPLTSTPHANKRSRKWCNAFAAGSVWRKGWLDSRPRSSHPCAALHADRGNRDAPIKEPTCACFEI